MKASNIKAEILNASAGSGKTYQLAYKYVRDILRNQPEDKGGGFDPYAYRRILAVTFTNKATEEMKSRILKQVHRLGAGLSSPYLKSLMEETSLSEKELRRRAARARTAILHDYSRFSILTNDTFFQRILRGFIKELGIDMNYNIELDATSLLTQSVDELMENIAHNADLRAWISEMIQENLIAGKQWNVREDFLRLRNELFKESTKRHITRITDKKQFKKRIFGYINRADKELARLQEIGRQACAMITTAGYDHSDFTRSFTLYFEKVAAGTADVASATIAKHRSDTPSEWFTKAKKPTCGLLALAEQLQPMLVEVCEYAPLAISRNLILQNYRSYALLNDIYRKAMDICHEENRMLLSETKHTIAEFVTETDAPFIYEKVGNRFERYMIDEFQDTSFREWKNFLPLLRNAMAQSASAAVLLVGDIKQSIYRWRGSDWSILGKVAPEDLAQNGNEISIDTLKNNFRSLEGIVTFNNECFDRIVRTHNARLNDMLLTATEQGQISTARQNELHDMLANAYAEHQQTARRSGTTNGYINVSTFDEVPDIVSRVKKIIDHGFKPCDITILVRGKAEAYCIAQQLLRADERNDERYGWDIMTQEALLLNNAPSVQFILAVMRLSINRNDATSRAIYLRYYHNCDFMHAFSDEESTLFDTLRALSVEDTFEHIAIYYAEFLHKHTAYVQALHEQVVQFCSGKSADTAMFLRWWDDNSKDLSVSIERSEKAIEIMTIHKAKGLQNKVILLPFCQWPLNPQSSSGRKTSILWAKPAADAGFGDEEEFPISASKEVKDSIFADDYYKEIVYSHIEAINLLYVAFTRACEQLHIFIPAERPTKNNSKTKSCSHVSDLIREALGISGIYESKCCFENGIFASPEPTESNSSSDDEPQHSSVRLTDYNISPVGIRLSSTMSHYFEEMPTLSPRDTGIMLHRAFEQARQREEIPQAVKAMVLDGLLSQEEATELQRNIDKVLDSSIAGEWFSGKWDKVLCESSIIVPNAGMKRPDRVMIEGKRAVVVDYKFGEREPAHRKQISAYIMYLRSMGYEDITGYVWYVGRGETDKIEP
ncbi:MAG: UvrD-helicase domain-containing protein [Alistipes sp.]|nr:UvrD-helicase domain-containing protein [Alistipes sp.]